MCTNCTTGSQILCLQYTNGNTQALFIYTFVVWAVPDMVWRSWDSSSCSSSCLPFVGTDFSHETGLTCCTVQGLLQAFKGPETRFGGMEQLCSCSVWWKLCPAPQIVSRWIEGKVWCISLQAKQEQLCVGAPEISAVLRISLCCITLSCTVVFLCCAVLTLTVIPCHVEMGRSQACLYMQPVPISTANLKLLLCMLWLRHVPTESKMFPQRLRL